MLALDKIRILDLTRLLPGSFTSLLLADYGAEVIMVEDTKGEGGRHIGPFINGLSYRHLMLGRNKKSITLNLRHAHGRELLVELAKKADVLIENFRPGYLDKLDLGYKRLQKINSQLIFCSLTGYGQTGPDRERPGHDINYISKTGVLGLSAINEGEISLPGVQMADLGGGSMMAVMGILLALIARVNTNEGQYIDVSMADGITSWLPLASFDYLAGGRAPGHGEHIYTGALACYNIYRTKDGRHLALGALEPKFWDNFCSWIGCAEFIPLQRDPTQQNRIKAFLQEKFRSRSLAEWLQDASGKDICLTPVNSMEEALHDPRIIAREMMFEVDHPVAGKIKQLGFPVKMSMTPAKYQRGAPLLGEHNREIFALIGLHQDDLESLHQEGII